jgi:hypothetical protein
LDLTTRMAWQRQQNWWMERFCRISSLSDETIAALESV